jgi:catechol 2,3-dioxygenase-like lactoylglutathione lyase family enzyme
VIRGIQHCALVVGELERSRRFYGDILGLREIPRPSNFSFAGAWFQVGDDELHLIVESDTTMRAGASVPGSALEYGLVTHLALEVDDLDATLEQVRERGAEIGSGPMARGDGVDQAFIRDPDGYVVEVFERTGADQSSVAPRLPVRERA